MCRRLALILTVFLAATALHGEVRIEVEDPYPIRGDSTLVMVTDESGPVEGAIVQVEYRPNSSTARTETLEPTDQSGTTSWAPRDPGLARLSVSGPEGSTGTMAISVRFTTFPVSGIAIMLFAGLLLFGGAGFGMSLLMRERKMPADEPPST